MTTEDFKRDILRLQPWLQRIAEHIVSDHDSCDKLKFSKKLHYLFCIIQNK